MVTRSGLVPRHAERVVEEALEDTRVVLVNGARQTGKSKAAATVRTADLAGLRHLAGLLGDRFVAGFVLYTGQQTLPFGDKLRAVPVEALWRAAP